MDIADTQNEISIQEMMLREMKKDFSESGGMTKRWAGMP